MEINTDNAKRIDAYINDHPECKLSITEPVSIQDQRQDIPVYRIPTNLILFSVRNGRFAAEYRERVEKEGRELDPEDEEDAKKIQDLLLQDEKPANILMEDIKRFGQKYPGIMTFDGYLVNGNRRMAVLNKLKEPGEDRFGYLLVARLPKGVSQKDLWKIEAGIQLSREEKLDYGPINTLLKFKEGKDAGLSEAQIANSLYGGYKETEIEEYLKRLELVEEYLEYIGHPKKYKEADRLLEHIIDLRKIIKNQKDHISSDDLLKTQRIAFQLIRDGTTHLDLRKINNILNETKARESFLQIADSLPTSQQPDIQSTEAPSDETDETDDEDNEEGFTAVQTSFYDCVDILNAAKKRDEPLALVTKALRNLDEIDFSNPHLREDKVKEKIRKIIEIVEKLKGLL